MRTVVGFKTGQGFQFIQHNIISVLNLKATHVGPLQFENFTDLTFLKLQ